MIHNNQGGYTAIASVLVITAVLLVVTTTASLTSIATVQQSLSYKKADEALFLVESCVADVLLTLNKTASMPATITIPEGSCTVILNAQVGDSWDFTVTGNFIGYTRSIQVVAQRTSEVLIESWVEL